jgi:glycosyltransferase involved in cell wall biosynthesis
MKLLYDGSKLNDASAARSIAVGGAVHSLLRVAFDPGAHGLATRWRLRGRALARQALERVAPRRGASDPFERILEEEIGSLLCDREFGRQLALAHRVDDRIFLVVGTLINRIVARYVEDLRDSGSLGLVASIKKLVALASSSVFVSLPYLLSFLQHSSDVLIMRDVRRAFRLTQRHKVVLITDTFFEVNGVSASIRRMIKEAMRRELDFTVVVCVNPEERERVTAAPEVRELMDQGRLKVFTAVASFPLPRYQGMQLHLPPVLELLKYLQESGFTKMQISTPGSMGLAGLLAAKTLQMETASTYHTAIPEYVEHYTRDIALEALAWRYMIVFYHLVDEVLVPSRYVGKLLHKRGLRNRKLLKLDRWVDPERFHPERRVADYFSRFGLAGGDQKVKFVYIGRLGVEKNLDLLARAYRRLRAQREDAHLILIGDGPHRLELERVLAGLPVTYTGFLGGDELPRAIASADVKVFPSTTDTWGNAPLEAQASGLPVIVSDVGGPAELMEDGVTGLRVRGRDEEALYAAMLELMDPERRRELGRNARDFIERERVDEPYTAIFDSETYRARGAVAPEPEPEAEAADGGWPPALYEGAFPPVARPRVAQG